MTTEAEIKLQTKKIEHKCFFVFVFSAGVLSSCKCTVLHLCVFGHLQAVYMFYALALVCDDYFVPSLEKICEVTNIVDCNCTVAALTSHTLTATLWCLEYLSLPSSTSVCIWVRMLQERPSWQQAVQRLNCLPLSLVRQRHTHTHFRYNLAVQPFIVQFDNSILIVRQ